MKRLFMLMTFLSLLVRAAPTGAQEVGGCDVDAFRSQMQTLVTQYQTAQMGIRDPNRSLAAAQDFQGKVNALTEACVKGAAYSVLPTEGKWMLTWKNTEAQFCPDQSRSVTATDRPIYLKVVDGQIVLEDLFTWPSVKLSASEQGYYYRQDITLIDGTQTGFDVVISAITPEQMAGHSTTYYPGIECELANDFTLTLVDSELLCMVGSASDVRFYTGPGVGFAKAGVLLAKTTADVNGYSIDEGGAKWWQMVSGGWIREDAVKEAGRCENVPEVKPE